MVTYPLINLCRESQDLVSLFFFGGGGGGLVCGRIERVPRYV